MLPGEYPAKLNEKLPRMSAGELRATLRAEPARQMTGAMFGTRPACRQGRLAELEPSGRG